MPLHRDKNLLRREMLAKRTAMDEKAVTDAGLSLVPHVVAYIERHFPKTTCIAGYVPIDKEMDVMPLLSALHEKNYRLALPAIDKRHEPLAFHPWQPGELLQPGTIFDRIYEPARHLPAVMPQLVLVPLLAFDRKGHRLGYGGGFYDRTLAEGRKKGVVFAMGIGYDWQEVASLPNVVTDQVLQSVGTESQVIDF